MGLNSDKTSKVSCINICCFYTRFHFCTCINTTDSDVPCQAGGGCQCQQGPAATQSASEASPVVHIQLHQPQHQQRSFTHHILHHRARHISI